MDLLKWSSKWILGDTPARNGYLIDINKTLTKGNPKNQHKTVFESKRIRDGTVVAIKRTRWAGLPIEYAYIVRENENWAQLDHENIVKILDAFDDQEFNDERVRCFYQVMDICSCDLDQWFFKNQNRDLETCKTMIGEIICGLSYLHSQNLMHRDLKPDNIFISLDGVCKIADFDITKRHNITQKGEHTNKVGNKLFVAPEQYNVDVETDGAYNLEADIYPLGIILMLFFTIFENPDQLMLKSNNIDPQMAKCINDLRRERLLPTHFFENFDRNKNKAIYDYLGNLIIKMTSDPADRPTAEQLYDNFINL